MSHDCPFRLWKGVTVLSPACFAAPAHHFYGSTLFRDQDCPCLNDYLAQSECVRYSLISWMFLGCPQKLLGSQGTKQNRNKLEFQVF